MKQKTIEEIKDFLKDKKKNQDGVWIKEYTSGHWQGIISFYNEIQKAFDLLEKVIESS